MVVETLLSSPPPGFRGRALGEMFPACVGPKRTWRIKGIFSMAPASQLLQLAGIFIF